MHDDKRPQFWTLEDKTYDWTMRQIVGLGGFVTAFLLAAMGSMAWAGGTILATVAAIAAMVWWWPCDPNIVSDADYLSDDHEGYRLLEQGTQLVQRRQLLLELKAELEVWPANRPPGFIDHLAHERKHWRTNWDVQIQQEEDLAGQQAGLVRQLRLRHRPSLVRTR